MSKLPDPSMARDWYVWAQRLFVWLKGFVETVSRKTPGSMQTAISLVTDAVFTGASVEYYLQDGYCFFTAMIPGGGSVAAVTVEDTLATMPPIATAGLGDYQFEVYGGLFISVGQQAISNPMVTVFINSTSPTEMKVSRSFHDTTPPSGFVLSGFYKVA